MTAAPIRYEQTGPAAVITLDRPEVLNAATPAMLDDLVAALDRADADDRVRAVIVTGAGRAFCAGADLSAGPDALAFGKDSPDAAQAAVGFREPGGVLSLRLLRCRKPVIAAINGPAVGVGVTMTLAMDVRLAADDAKFAFPFTRRGMAPESVSSWLLPRLVGMGRALDWMVTGRTFGASEALAGGLLTRLHPRDDLLPAALDLAEEIARDTAPVSVALTRLLLWKAYCDDGGPHRAHHAESLATILRGHSRDAAEGITAFRDRRAPRFPMTVSADLPDEFPWQW